MSLLEILERGGWVMWPIYLSFLASCAIACERWIVLRRMGSARPNERLERVATRMAAGDREGALRTAAELNPILRDLALTALRLEAAGRERRRDRLAIMARDRVDALQHNLAVIATLAAVAPLLGFLGTIVGMIRAFMTIEAMEGNVTPAILAGGIWEALVTTGAGLAVGIVALVLHNVLAARIDAQAGLLGRSLEVLLDATADEGVEAARVMETA